MASICLFIPSLLRFYTQTSYSCDPSAHLCGEICDLADKRGCQSNCTKVRICPLLRIIYWCRQGCQSWWYGTYVLFEASLLWQSKFLNIPSQFSSKFLTRICVAVQSTRSAHLWWKLVLLPWILFHDLVGYYIRVVVSSLTSRLRNEDHESCVCDSIMTCPISCQLCRRLCSLGNHLHGLEDNALHLCG